MCQRVPEQSEDAHASIWKQEFVEETLLTEISLNPIQLAFGSPKWEIIYQNQTNVQRRKFFPIVICYFFLHSFIYWLKNSTASCFLIQTIFLGSLCFISLMSVLMIFTKYFQRKTKQMANSFYVIIIIWLCMYYLVLFLRNRHAVELSVDFYFAFPLIIGIVLDVSFLVIVNMQVLLTLASMFSESVAAGNFADCFELVLNFMATVGGTYTILRFARHRFLHLVQLKREQFARYKETSEMHDCIVNSKVKYIATVAHDIGTPLNAFRWTLDSLKESRISHDQAKLIHIGECAIELLQVMRNEALDYGRQAAGRTMVPKLQQVDFVELVKNCIRILNVAGSYSDLPVEIYRDPTLPVLIETDYDWVWTMVLVLLSNARKYGKQGSIRVYIFLIKGEQVRLEVVDEGIGTPLNKRHRLFKPFPSITKKDMAGLGLGLYTVQTKATLLGGSVGMRDNPVTKGSVFWFQIPINTASTVCCSMGSMSMTPGPLGKTLQYPVSPYCLLLGEWNTDNISGFMEYTKAQYLMVDEIKSESLLNRHVNQNQLREYSVVFWLRPQTLEEDDEIFRHRTKWMFELLHKNATTFPAIYIFTAIQDEKLIPKKQIVLQASAEPDATNPDCYISPDKNQPVQSKPLTPSKKMRSLLKAPASNFQNKSPKIHSPSTKIRPLLEGRKRAYRFRREISLGMFDVENAPKRQKDFFFPPIPDGERRYADGPKLKLCSSLDSSLPGIDYLNSARNMSYLHSSREKSYLNSARNSLPVQRDITSDTMRLKDHPYVQIFLKPSKDMDLIHALMTCQPHRNSHQVSLERSWGSSTFTKVKLPGQSSNSFSYHGRSADTFIAEDSLCSMAEKRERPSSSRRNLANIRKSRFGQRRRESPHSGVNAEYWFETKLNEARSQCSSDSNDSLCDKVAAFTCESPPKQKLKVPTIQSIGESIKVDGDKSLGPVRLPVNMKMMNAITQAKSVTQRMANISEIKMNNSEPNAGVSDKESSDEDGQNVTAPAPGIKQSSQNRRTLVYMKRNSTEELLGKQQKFKFERAPHGITPRGKGTGSRNDAIISSLTDTQDFLQKVLVVDDDKITLKMATRMLCKEGFTVETAQNGKEGLEKLKSNIFRVVLMDYNMPIMDGLTCIQKFRKWEESEMETGNRGVKQHILMFSANAAERNVEIAINGGADGFLAKPIKMKDLLEAISMRANKV